jgi:hypothetical protein
MSIFNFFTKKEVKAEPVPVEEVKPKPYIQIVSDRIDPVHGLEIEFDWSPEFIAELRKHGYTGLTDEQLVQKWLEQFSKSIAEKMNTNEYQ